MQKHFKYIIVLALITGNLVYSQEDNDINLWTSIGVNYELNKKWEIGLEGHLRLKENLNTIDEYFPELTVKRKIIKGLKFGVGLRYIRNNDTRGRIQGYENHFRIHTDMAYKHKIKRFTLKYRLRYQNKDELGKSTSDGDYAINRFRFKTGTNYNIKNWKLDPELSVELFNRFGNNTSTEFDKYRITFGTSYKIKKAGKIKVFYRLEKDIVGANRPKNHIIGLNYTYTIK